MHLYQWWWGEGVYMCLNATEKLKNLINQDKRIFSPDLPQVPNITRILDWDKSRPVWDGYKVEGIDWWLYFKTIKRLWTSLFLVLVICTTIIMQNKTSIQWTPGSLIDRSNHKIIFSKKWFLKKIIKKHKVCISYS